MALPSKTAENQAAGIEKRLLAVVPKPHPSLVPPARLPRPFLYVPGHHHLGIPPIYLRPLEQMPREWRREVAHIAARRKVQEPHLPWPADVTPDDLQDSTPCLLGQVLIKDDAPLTSPMLRTNLSALTKQFWALKENQWLQHTEPMDFDLWVSRFNPSRQQQLRQAREEAERDGLMSHDAIMSVFIKTETSSNATDPRNISPRSAKFLSVLGPYVAQIETLAKACPYLVKGLTPEQRGARVSEFWRSAVIETDFSRFDMTVSEDIINTVEKTMFRIAYPEGLHPLLDECMDQLTTLTGVSNLGVQYSVAGTRASGDAHTSIANGVINRFVIWACLRNLSDTTWCSFHEGDDGVIHCDDAVRSTIVDYLPYAGLLGFRLKIVEPPTHAHATFCGRFTCVDCKREFCDLPRTLAKFHTTYKQGDAKSLVLAKALSYFATDAHTPIVGPMCAALIAHLSPKVSDRLLRRRLAAMGWWDRQRCVRGLKATPTEVSPCCRASVALITGWDTELQVQTELQLKGWERGVTTISPIWVDDHLVDGPGHVVYQAP